MSESMAAPRKQNAHVLTRLKNSIRDSKFTPTFFSPIINPYHIIRSSLYYAIKSRAVAFTGTVLDFGCGSKPYQMLFTRADSYLGVDIAVSGHNHAASEIDYFYDGHVLPFSDNSFDNVVTFETLEHVFNLDEILAEIHRVVRPTGKLLITVPFAFNEHEAPYDFARYTSYGLSHILDAHGFSVQSITKTGGNMLAVGQLFISYLFQHVAPRNAALRTAFQIAIIAPCTAISYLLHYTMPKREDLFCNLVVVAVARK